MCKGLTSPPPGQRAVVSEPGKSDSFQWERLLIREHRWYSSLQCHILESLLYTVFPRSSVPVARAQKQPPDPLPKKDLRKSNWRLRNPQSPNTREIFFNGEILKLTTSTCSSRSLIWLPYWRITKPDKLLHDPVDISWPAGKRNIWIVFAF